MTNDEINTLMAKIMGEDHACDNCGEIGNCGCEQVMIGSGVRPYATDLNQVMQVVRKLEDEEDWAFVFYSSALNEDGEGVHIEIMMGQTPMFDEFIKGRLNASAICKAILKAKGLDNE